MLLVFACIMGTVVHRSSRVSAKFPLLVFTGWHRNKILIITVLRLAKYTCASIVRSWSGRVGHGIAVGLTEGIF